MDPSLSEADITLDLARRIEGRLAATGVLAVITRSADADPDEVERADTANRLGADLVVSLHCETSESATANGVAAYFYGHDRPGAWSAVGERLADLMRREVVARTGLVDCQSHPRTWDLLRRTTMPAVRLDVGYLTNPDDATLLASPAFRDTVADAVVVAIQRLYLGEQDMSMTGVLHLSDVLAQAGRTPWLVARLALGGRGELDLVEVRERPSRPLLVDETHTLVKVSGGDVVLARAQVHAVRAPVPGQAAARRGGSPGPGRDRAPAARRTARPGSTPGRRSTVRGGNGPPPLRPERRRAGRRAAPPPPRCR